MNEPNEPKTTMKRKFTAAFLGRLLGAAAIGASFEAQDVSDLSKAASGDGWRLVGFRRTRGPDLLRKGRPGVPLST